MSESTSNLKTASGGVPSESTPDETTEAEYFNPFGWIPPALLVWFAIFGLYEVAERTLLTGANPDLLHLLHILRGTGTSFLLAGLVAWYILRRRADREQVAPRTRGLRTIVAEGEARELITQERWVIRLRWVAIAGVVGVTLVSWLSFQFISDHSALALLLIAAVMAGYNTLFAAIRPTRFTGSRMAFVQVFLDLSALTLMLFFAGGIHNPFFLFYVFHIVIAGILLRRGETYLVTLAACALFSGMVLLQESAWVPYYPLHLVEGTEMRLTTGWIHTFGVLGAFVATACCTAHFTTTIMAKLRLRGEEIVEASEILSQERSKTDSIVRSVGAGLLVLDLEDRIVWANEIAQRWFGDGLVGESCHRRLWQMENRCPNCPVMQTRSSGSTFTCEHSASVGDRRRFFLTSSSPVRSADGEVENILVLVQDITAMKEMQVQLVQAGKMVAVGQLAAGIAHEINNPLAVVASSSEILSELQAEKDLADEEKADITSRHFKKIEDNIYRCKDIIQGLLGFARREEEGFEPVDLVAVLDETVDLVGGSDRARQRSINRDYRSDGTGSMAPLSLTRSRPRQIQQVFLNLLLNALDAVEPGGQVTLSARHDGQGIEVAVADNGDGIPPEHLDRIFEPFYTSKPVGKGTGLGLYISHQIVGSLHGTLIPETRSGEGATFRVWLPFDSSSGQLQVPFSPTPIVHTESDS
ncbi:MAG: ATP-binding protein [Planctomycetota bacterium]|jgi:PAS domain S-box-containing protein|nr:ATP-binding protein [Planctomycetota bacterium]